MKKKNQSKYIQEWELIEQGAPTQEPQRQEYFINLARTMVHNLSEEIGRQLRFHVTTIGCQMNARDSEKNKKEPGRCGPGSFLFAEGRCCHVQRTCYRARSRKRNGAAHAGKGRLDDDSDRDEPNRAS